MVDFLAPRTDLLVPPISRDYGMADWLYERFVKKLEIFEDELDDSHDLGIQVGGFLPGSKYYLIDVGYWNPNLIDIDGVSEDGDPINLIQNISQFNVMLVTMKRRLPSGPFRIAKGLMASLPATDADESAAVEDGV